MTPDQIATKADVEKVMAQLDDVKRLLASVTVTQDDKWLSISKAATRLECSESTIRRKIANGEFEAKGAGKARRVRI